MTRKRKREGILDIIDIDRFTREVDYRDCEADYVYNEFKTPFKIANYLQTIYDRKAMETNSSSGELRRYEEKLIDVKCMNSRCKSGRKRSEIYGRYRKGMKYPSETKCGRRSENVIPSKNRTSYSSGDTMNYEENRRINKYFEDIKRLERRYEKLFKKQRNKISILTEMCQRCLEQFNKMSQIIENNNTKAAEAGNVERRDRKLNYKQVKLPPMTDDARKASGDNVNRTESLELLVMEKCYERLAQKLEELKCYFDMKTNSDKFDNATCASCKKNKKVNSEIISSVAVDSEHDIPVKKSDKAIATDFGKERDGIHLDTTVIQDSIQDLPNYAEHLHIQNYFTNMYCSVVLDKHNGGQRSRQPNAEDATDSGGPDDEEFGLRNWQQRALKILHAAEVRRSHGTGRSNSGVILNFPDLFPLLEEASERPDAEGGNPETGPQMNCNDSSFNLDDPIKLYEQCRQFGRPSQELDEEAHKPRIPAICEYLRALYRKGTAFCEQLLCCRLQ